MLCDDINLPKKYFRCLIFDGIIQHEKNHFIYFADNLLFKSYWSGISIYRILFKNFIEAIRIENIEEVKKLLLSEKDLFDIKCDCANSIGETIVFMQA